MTKAKILIVDDSATARMQLKKDLQVNGYEVVEGRDGVEGLELLTKNPDAKLVITDINMPVMDGLQMSKQIKDSPNFKSIPIFVLSTESTQEMKAKGKEVGVLAWITKPYAADKLLLAIGQVLK